jgi:uncharacterized protein YceH (UPF0502 family)
MSADEQAIMCVLMLRGPQTPGELKQRAERMHAFADLDGVHGTLGQLIERGLVERLQRRPGQKEERYLQLLGDPEEATGQASAALGAAGPQATAAPTPAATGESSALAELAERVGRLERQLAELLGSSARESGQE